MKTGYALLLWLVTSVTYAYTILDVANLDVNLPPGWKLSDIKRQNGMIVTTYTHAAYNADKAESMVTVEMPKEAGKDAYAAINEMAQNVYNQATDQHCIASELITPTKVDHPFKVWSQMFECEPSASGIVQMYIDADPKTIYLITYTTPVYPFTAEDRTRVNNLLMSSLQVCYKNGTCAAPNN